MSERISIDSVQVENTMRGLEALAGLFRSREPAVPGLPEGVATESFNRVMSDAWATVHSLNSSMMRSAERHRSDVKATVEELARVDDEASRLLDRALADLPEPARSESS